MVLPGVQTFLDFQLMSVFNPYSPMLMKAKLMVP